MICNVCKNNGYSGKSFIINDNGKLAWNLNYKKRNNIMWRTLINYPWIIK